MILLREILSNRDFAFKETSVYGEPFITVVDDVRVFPRQSIIGAPIYTIIADKLFEGISVAGRPIAMLVGDKIYPDIQIIGEPLARIVGPHSFKGTAVSGYPIVTVPSKNVNTLFAATYHALRG